MKGHSFKITQTRLIAAIFILSVTLLISCIKSVPTLKLVAENSTNRSRAAQNLYQPAEQLRSFFNIQNLSALVLRQADGRVVPTQWVGRGKDSVLFFQADFGPRQVHQYVIRPEEVPPELPSSKVFARFVPERKDDFAWENDCIAYRMYGPALQATGEISSGVDVWVKRTDSLIINKWYTPGYNYHKDQGQGLDGYKVGPSRGCGGLAVWHQNRLWPSANFTNWNIQENGPLRAEFSLDYAPWPVGSVAVREWKTIQLDSGRNFNHFRSRFDWQNGPDRLEIAIGIVKRKGGQVQYDAGAGWLAYVEPEMKPNGVTYCALILPPGTEFRQVETSDHYLLLMDVARNGEISYYAGAGWSKSATFKTQDDWFTYVADFAADLHTPIQLKILEE